MTILQLFCTVSDLIADKQAPGVDEARMLQAIREASEYLQKEIGWFIPVTETRLFNGRGKPKLFPGALLAIMSVTNDNLDLDTSDYILKPDSGMWSNGPYTEVILPNNTGLLWSRYDNGVVISGQWGKYNRSASIGANVQDEAGIPPGQSDSQTTLKVSDGSRVSPGMTLLIENEQQVVTGWSDPTNDMTALAAAAGASDDTLTVDDATLINIGEIVRIEFEQMKVLDKRTDYLSVQRGWNGTNRVDHAEDASIDVYRTVTVERGVNGAAAETHANDTVISRYFPPDDVQYLCKEIATLIVNKALGGYQGRTGNAETGVVFYNDAFPKYDIERVKANYYIPKGGGI